MLNNTFVDGNLSNGSLSKIIHANSTHTVLSLRNFIYPSAVLTCYRSEYIIGGTIITTYSKPSNISCIWNYTDPEENGVPQALTCNWEHQNHSPLPITYTVLCASAKNTTCNSEKTTCTFEKTDEDGVIQLSQNFTVTVTAKTAHWEASSSREFNPFNIIKINRPKLKITTFPDHLLVEWSQPEEDCHCQVKYSKQVLSKTLKSKREAEVTIGNLESCTKYKFAVRCARENAIWSDWSDEKMVLTKLNKRHVKLHLWRMVAKPDKNGIRKVHAMWTGIPSTCEDTLTYTIKQSGVKDTDTSCGNSTCDVDVNQDAHRLNLTVFSDKSLLVEDSIYVPAIGESLPQVTDIQTSTLGGIILVSWKAPVQPVSGYVIDYTHNGHWCYWKESKYTNATLYDLLDKTPYNITVTPLFDDKTGHGTQALQICSRLGDPGIVTIDVLANHKSALVSWNVTSQEVCSGDVVSYTIFYSTENGPQFNVTLDKTKQHISLKDLNPDTQYNVYVKATALTGTAKSSVRLFKTKTFDPTLITVLTVCGSITIVLVLSVGLCCAAQWKKFKEKPVPNPGLSSVALWPPTSHQQVNSVRKDLGGMSSIHFKEAEWPFIKLPESDCVRVYTEETQRISTTPLPIDGSPFDQTVEYTVPVIALAPDVENENPVEPVETQHPSSPEESTALLSPESNLPSPYRSQSSVETPVQRIDKQCKRAAVKQQEKTPPLTVYVTLDMFEQDQCR
ncbi:hypothetical protein L3Q82_010986 [Scortum barcoo]|uniref:Uncharacterized protein n=1 Tax=Scortum barcoo TaxID=214431 RepID=A0ACB8W828_9TELE|nr:hypothetical protein L3Q82_010986 [Scortum barcoo]